MSPGRRGKTTNASRSLMASSLAFLNACRAALCIARHGVPSQPVPVALVGECSRRAGGPPQL
jgi:hypothetical protein